MVRKVSARTLRFLINLWPPYIGAGIRVRHIAPDFRSVTVDLRLRWRNRNYVGTHFGGSLYAMTDPFLMVMLVQTLGTNIACGTSRARSSTSRRDAAACGRDSICMKTIWRKSGA